ncbi:AsnC family protein [Salmonella enterica]|nr:AsnC family protein [Salmonella enterica subsp. enterica serovar Infantis]EGI5078509.1 AsnC family protein [Salmonella enterica subsp. enterica serovar Infantis]EKZ8805285.1 AsnC family protein [Salmonella enterica]
MILEPMGTPGKCPACERAWTPEEDELLIALYPLMTCKEITKHLNRTLYAVRGHVQILIQKGLLKAKYNLFTPDEDAFIRANRHNMTLSEVAVCLGRSADNVCRRAKLLKIRYQKLGDLHYATKYPDSDVDLICALRDDGMTYMEIAKKFEMPFSSVVSICHVRFTAADIVARELLPQ